MMDSRGLGHSPCYNVGSHLALSKSTPRSLTLQQESGASVKTEGKLSNQAQALQGSYCIANMSLSKM